ncbi:MAG: hypothetical protein JNK64_35755 [Myxococcales bacterium]|nr:hypothetical protein [Myxococcales bacterium]
MRRLVVLAAMVVAVPPAAGFQIGTTVTARCHEAITDDARRTAGWPTLPRQPLTEADRRAIADLPFTPPTDPEDPRALALLIGVRSNDLRDNAPTDLAALVHIHNDPADQPAHCIRRREDDGATGDASALAACRGFILDELTRGGWFAPTVDERAREPVAVFLAFRGRVELALPRAAYHLGRGLHALEDGFTHTLRNPTDGRVRSVLNWIDLVDDGYQPARDGLGHQGWIDDCTLTDDARVAQGVDLARAAAVEVLAALALPDPVARRLAVERALDGALALEPGCALGNDYCGAVELRDAAGCCDGGGGGGPGAAALIVVVALAWTRGRRRAAATAAVLAGLALAPPAQADDGPLGPGLRLTAHGGAALDRGALALGGGATWHGARWHAGGAVEWNPWFSLDAARTRPGTINAYATLGYTWLATPCVELHTRVHGGGSVILFDLVGVDRGNLGLFVGAGLLGATVRLRDDLGLTIEPSDFAMPAPQLTGFPFYYRQYRISLGLEWRPGW